MIDVNDFRARLLEWYRQNARPMPWRAAYGERPDPYHEWLSEVMLQQTVVKAVIPYFEKFIKRWPRIDDLAAARQEEVLKEWAGLGYYSRARNLHKCAQVIVREYHGQFPKTEQELVKLPGIGPYTAAAISAIAFGRPAAVMDGNVERVLARLTALDKPIREGKKALYADLKILTENRADDPGEFAQGMMELGAMVCTPNSPKCDICPVKKYCTAYQQGCVAEFPVRPIKQVKPVRYGTVFFIRNEAGELLFERRPDKGLLGGMIGLPGTSWDSDPSKLVSPYVANDIILSPVPDFHVTHTFTHFQLRLGANIANCQKVYKSPSSFWHRPEEYDKIGLPNLFRKAIKQYMAI